MAGNGSSGQRKDKLIRDALMLAANRVHEDDPQSRKKLYVAAAKIMDLACEGDIAAFKEVADRLDGKAVQSLDIDTTKRIYVIEAKAERPTAQTWETQHKPKSETTIQ